MLGLKKFAVVSAIALAVSVSLFVDWSATGTAHADCHPSTNKYCLEDSTKNFDDRLRIKMDFQFNF